MYYFYLLSVSFFFFYTDKKNVRKDNVATEMEGDESHGSNMTTRP